MLGIVSRSWTCTFPLLVLPPPPMMVRANLSPRATSNTTEDADATGRIAMIGGGDDENAKVVVHDGDEKTAISSNKASSELLQVGMMWESS